MKIRHLTPDVIAAWKAADFTALHSALGLSPWNVSPLPGEIIELGVDQGEPREWMGSAQQRDWRNAQALQRELLEVAGWPDCRKAYEENLREAEDWLAYCQELVDDPTHGGTGTGSDPESRRRKLEDAEAKLAYRRELLDGLDEKLPT